MCGIAGIVYAEERRPVEEGVLESMCHTLRHRGPDDRGIYCARNAGLAAARLSIIDVEGGHQPIGNEDRSVWAVFNGEIYNFGDLGQDLRRRGHEFRTRCDTEVIVHAYEEYGADFVRHLNGMFSIALWDSRRRTLWLARDRIGIKPLFYSFCDGALVFGSELKALLAYPRLERRLDRSALNDYLSYEYVPTPRTLFQNVHKLPPGHVLRWSGAAAPPERYWDVDLARSERAEPMPMAVAAERLTDCLRDAVRMELVSDVPVGILLSGGVDSSTIAAVAAEVSPRRLSSFTVCFEDRSFDESAPARSVARHYGLDHHELMLTPELALDTCRAVPEFLDEPLGDSSLIPTYLLSRLAGGHVKVALGGDGGDELFGGYSTLQAHRLVDYYERIVPDWIRLRMVPWVIDRLPVSFDNISLDFKLRRFVAGRGIPAILRHHQWIGSFTPGQKQHLWSEPPEAEGTYETAWNHLRESRAKDPLNQILYCDMKLYLEGDILPKVDRASMANSLEVRVPFLNRTVVDFVTGLPNACKLRGLTTKYLLRKAMRRRLPGFVLQRRKKGFNMPVAKWLTGPLRPLVDEYLSPERLGREGFFHASYVEQLVKDHLAGRADHRKLIWTLLMFEMWYERWGRSSP